MRLINKRAQAWRYNFYQLIFGLLCSLFVEGSIYGVLVFGLSQSIFTYFVFFHAGSSKRFKIFKFFVIGELFKIISLFVFGYICIKSFNVDMLGFVLGLIIMQLMAVILPLVLQV